MFQRKSFLLLVTLFMFSFENQAMETGVEVKKPLYRGAVFIIAEPNDGMFYQALSIGQSSYKLPSFDRRVGDLKTEAKNYLNSMLRVSVKENDIHNLFHFEAIHDGRKIITDVVAVFVSEQSTHLVWGAMGKTRFFFPEENSLLWPIEKAGFVQQLQLVVLHGLQGGTCNEEITAVFHNAIKALGETATGFFAFELSAFTEYVKARKKNTKAGCIIS